jgi:hypothetical protein
MQTRRYWRVSHNNVQFGEGIIVGAFIGAVFMGILWLLVGR